MNEQSNNPTSERDHAQREPQNQASQGKGNKPIDTLRDGALKVAVFRNEYEQGPSYSVQPGRIYTDDQGNIRESTNFRAGEALRLAHLMTRAHDRVAEHKEQMKAASRTKERDRV